MKPMEILEQLERGDISTDKAISLLQKYKSRCEVKEADKKGMKVRKAHWMKIRVRDDGHKFCFYLPISLFSLGFSIGKLAVGSRFMPEDEDLDQVRKVLKSIDRRDIKKLLNAVRESGKTDLVKVEDGDSIVNISLI